MLADVTQEALRLVTAAGEAAIDARLIGGTAIRLHLQGDPHPLFQREIQDIDLVIGKRDGRRMAAFLSEQGYVPNQMFNATNGDRRLLFYDEAHSRQVDVFIETFEMCHVLPVAEELSKDPLTVPLADLLLTKLQIVSLNEKDRVDAYALLHEHEVGPDDVELIDPRRIAELCARDWGLYRTLQLNFDRLRVALPASGLDEQAQASIDRRIAAIEAAREAHPKSMKWKARARVGDRLRWYEEPDEVE
jgi:hypothetical protein